MTKRKPDYIFLFAVFALSAVGLIMIFSASPTMGLKLGDSFYFIKRHLIYLLLGYFALYFGMNLDLSLIRKWSGTIFVTALALLLFVYLPGVGRKVLGAARWIDLGILSFQPSEFMKFSMVLFLAHLFAGWKDRIKDFWRGLVPILALIALIAALIIKQPDLGTAIAILLTSFVMLFVAGAQAWHLLIIGGAGITGLVVLSVTSAYRFRRIAAYIDPWKDPQGVGFHIIQSLLAVGSGGIFGLGLGASRQKFFYLPQQFTDFIFAILCEELGFIGAVSVVLLFVIFALRGFRIAFAATDRFHSLLAAGLVAWLSLQAIINMMVVVGLIPTTGIPLPFISYGGTATIMNLFSAGILLNISKR